MVESVSLDPKTAYSMEVVGWYVALDFASNHYVVQYFIKIKGKGKIPKLAQTHWYVSRRYSDFIAIRNAMSEYPSKHPFPSKDIFKDHFTDEFIAKRASKLNAWLKTRVKYTNLAKQKFHPLEIFLTQEWKRSIPSYVKRCLGGLHIHENLEKVQRRKLSQIRMKPLKHSVDYDTDDDEDDKKPPRRTSVTFAPKILDAPPGINIKVKKKAEPEVDPKILALRKKRRKVHRVFVLAVCGGVALFKGASGIQT